MKSKKIKNLLREPLIHFFVLGLAIFGLHAVLERNPEAVADDPYLIEVSSRHRMAPDHMEQADGP